MMIKNSGYLKIEEIETKHKLLYDLLEKFHNICEKEGLFYSLYAGSLLGAVREEGIIPWDDDVDVSMPRADYERFIQVIREKYSKELKILAYPEENYIYPYAKLCSKNSVLYELPLNKKYYEIALYIDIFPVDGCSNNVKHEERRLKYLAKLKHWREVATCAKIGVSPCWWKKTFVVVKLIRYGIARAFGYKFFLSREVKEAMRYSYEDSENVISTCITSLKGKMTKSEYEDRTLYKFGRLTCWGMKNYDEHLKNMYGNYMQRPPKEQQCAKHLYDLYVKVE